MHRRILDTITGFVKIVQYSRHTMFLKHRALSRSLTFYKKILLLWQNLITFNYSRVYSSSTKSPPHAPRLYAEVCNTCPRFNAIKPPDWGTVKQLLRYLGHLREENVPKSMCLAPKVTTWSPERCSAVTASLTCRVLVWSSVYEWTLHPLAQSPEITSSNYYNRIVEVDQNSWELKNQDVFSQHANQNWNMLYIVIRVNCISADNFVNWFFFLLMLSSKHTEKFLCPEVIFTEPATSRSTVKEEALKLTIIVFR